MNNKHIQLAAEKIKDLNKTKRFESIMKSHYYLVILIVFTAAVALLVVNNEPVIDLVDTTAPVVDAGDDMTVEATSPAGAEVKLHGSATDAVDMGLDFVWSEGGTVLGTEADLTITLGLGTHTLTLNATDDSGNIGTDTVVYTVSFNYTYTVVNVYPHDKTAFTQGLIFEDGVLYEGTGRYGQSTLRRVELETGNVTQLYSLPDQFFGEGITIFDDKIIQLTWKSGKGFVYDKSSFDLLQEFTYSTDGWGITHDGSRLIMSDGTATLYFLDPETFQIIGQVEVYDEEPVTMLNELEYIHGMVYANIWLDEKIAIINPQTGQVTGWIDLEGLKEAENQNADVLNGIAYDAEADRLFVTGKLWSKLYEIELVPTA